MNTLLFLDPHVSFDSYDINVIANVYESLLGYCTCSSPTPVPLLASSFTVSSSGSNVAVTLRSGINFADGNPLNAEAVYFSLNRLLVQDGSTPNSHGSQSSWILQQLLDQSLSSFFSGPQPYDSTWLNEVLAQNFVDVTGTLTLTLNILHPTSGLYNIMAGTYASIIDPLYVMPKDVSLWTSQGYTLPFPTLSGSETQQINEYFQDEISTCNTGITPSGCGATYLDSSPGTSEAGTGPYILQSFASNTNDLVLVANDNYWGGLSGLNMQDHIQTININYVPGESQRISDLKAAASSGQALYADVQNPPDVVNQNAWLNNNRLLSSISGVSLYGPFNPTFLTFFDSFTTNVTNPNTGNYFRFQPFADIRFRLAFADAVDMNQINTQYNDKFALVAQNAIPPSLPPSGSYNPSIAPIYSYDLLQTASLLQSAMASPITRFTLPDGSPAPTGTFDNSFGPNNPQTITLYYISGTAAEQAVLNEIANNVNAISSQDSLGLTIHVVGLPLGQLVTEAFSHELYMYSLGWLDDYPWVNDFLQPIYAPRGVFSSADNMNFATMGTLYNQAVAADASGNIPALISASNAMSTFANQEVMYLWTFWPTGFWAITSNVQGVFENPAFYGIYFATLTVGTSLVSCNVPDHGGANLQHADLKYCNLAGLNMQGDDLQGANLFGANLGGANLQDAILQGADLQGANTVGTNFAGANMQKSNLQYDNLAFDDLSGANLQHSNLQSVNLQGANLEGAILQGSNLEGTPSAYTVVSSANLSNAILSKILVNQYIVDSPPATTTGCIGCGVL